MPLDIRETEERDASRRRFKDHDAGTSGEIPRTRIRIADTLLLETAKVR